MPERKTGPSNGARGPRRPIKEPAPGYWPRVVVRFGREVDLPYREGAERALQERGWVDWKALSERFGDITLTPLFSAVDPDELRRLTDHASELDPDYHSGALEQFFRVDVPAPADPDELAKTLAGLPGVVTAYVDPPGDDPLVNATDDPRSTSQGYLDPAPTGIDAEFAWTLTGGDGAGQRVVDLERGWTLDHEDLVAHGATLLHGVLLNSSRPHGTAVLGEIAAVDNALGCVGITPNVASVDVTSYNGSTRPNAILAALPTMSFGDVLIIEAQVDFGGWVMIPIEALDAEYEALRLATALGIVVIAAAGNGGNDLDTYATAGGQQVLNRSSADFRDSGAIMVGAGSSASPHTRLGFSNFGSRIDCYAWGENVDTTSSTSGGSTTSYNPAFNGTSSATPIITGAALAIQGIAEATIGRRFSPREMRRILSNPATGTASANPAADRIGVMPDLRAITQGGALGVAADVYLRDFVGDVGDPHSGAISASPDVILRKVSVANPQAAFGQGSGTENDNALGSEAEAGQDNYIYVRARNRGGSPANGVTADVYWAPPATLLTPDLWNLVGTAAFPAIPSGDQLTAAAELVWPAAAVPATGHYCFVALAGNAQDPAPGPADFLDWGNFQTFIRENNNVTWRNFNVVDNDPSAGGDPKWVELEFLAPGPPDAARRMALEVVARLPEGSRLIAEMPRALADAMKVRGPAVRGDKKGRTVRVPINPHGATRSREVMFPARARFGVRLLASIPKQARDGEYEVFARQLYERREVGRVTWRLMSTEAIAKRERRFAG